MCLMFFYVNPSPSTDTFSLVLIMNRDEFMARETLPAAWKDGVLAGRDMEKGKEGGTWLGTDEKGRVGALTNIYVGKRAPVGKGRGFLVMDYLKGAAGAKEYLQRVGDSKDGVYSPFNLCLFEREGRKYTAHYYGSAVAAGVRSEGPVELDGSIHGLGNHLKSTPFLKTARGEKDFRNIIAVFDDVGSLEALKAECVNLLNDTECQYPDSQIEKQGGGPEGDEVGGSAGSWPDLRMFEKGISCIHVDMCPIYGTRMQTLIFVDYDLNVTFVERTKKPHPDKPNSWIWDEREFRYQLTP